ncbi:MAG: AAA family ATPase [Gemmatimonadota bacterium]|nr:AAA family ATPase [Gemmatimonadota bacterium]
MIFLFLHGFPGAGKFTVGRELERLTGYPLFHNHLTVDLVSTLFEFGSDEFVDLREHIWLEAFERSARAGLDGLIFTFAAERTVPEGFVARACEAVERAGGEMVFVEVACEPDEIRRRVEDPERRRFGKLASAELLDALLDDGTIHRLEPPGQARRIAVDTTDLSPEAAAEEIVRKLRA